MKQKWKKKLIKRPAIRIKLITSIMTGGNGELRRKNLNIVYYFNYLK